MKVLMHGWFLFSTWWTVSPKVLQTLNIIRAWQFMIQQRKTKTSVELIFQTSTVAPLQSSNCVNKRMWMMWVRRVLFCGTVSCFQVSSSSWTLFWFSMGRVEGAWALGRTPRSKEACSNDTWALMGATGLEGAWGPTWLRESQALRGGGGVSLQSSVNVRQLWLISLSVDIRLVRRGLLHPEIKCIIPKSELTPKEGWQIWKEFWIQDITMMQNRQRDTFIENIPLISLWIIPLLRVFKLSKKLDGLTASGWNPYIILILVMLPYPYLWTRKCWQRMCCLSSCFTMENCSFSLICFCHKLCNLMCPSLKIG